MRIFLNTLTPTQKKNRFEDNNGDGVLTKDGFANISDWPGYAAGKNKGVAGASSRGGSWYTTAADLRISGRQKGGFTGAYRLNTTGFRCVRSAWQGWDMGANPQWSLIKTKMLKKRVDKNDGIYAV